MRQLQPHQRVAGQHHCHVRGEVRLRSTVRLDIGVVGIEQLEGPIDCQLLDFVHYLAPAVIPPPRIALGVFVGELRSHGFENRTRYEILRGDEFEPVLLPGYLSTDQSMDTGIRLFQTREMIVGAVHRIVPLKEISFSSRSRRRYAARRVGRRPHSSEFLHPAQSPAVEGWRRGSPPPSDVTARDSNLPPPRSH